MKRQLSPAQEARSEVTKIRRLESHSRTSPEKVADCNSQDNSDVENDADTQDLKICLQKLDAVRPIVEYLYKMAGVAKKMKLRSTDELDPCIILGIPLDTPAPTVMKIKRKIGYSIHPDRFYALTQTFQADRREVLNKKLSRAFSLISNSAELLLKMQRSESSQRTRGPVGDPPPYAANFDIPPCVRMPLVPEKPSELGSSCVRSRSPDEMEADRMFKFCPWLAEVGNSGCRSPLKITPKEPVKLDQGFIRFTIGLSDEDSCCGIKEVRSLYLWAMPPRVSPGANASGRFPADIFGVTRYVLGGCKLPIKTTYAQMPIIAVNKTINLRFGASVQGTDEKFSTVDWIDISVTVETPPSLWAPRALQITIDRLVEMSRTGKFYAQELRQWAKRYATFDTKGAKLAELKDAVESALRDLSDQDYTGLF